MKRSGALLLSVATTLVAAFGAGPTASFVKTSDWGSGWEGKPGAPAAAASSHRVPTRASGAR
jgi:hypothetical protein